MLHRTLCALAVALAVATGLLTNPSAALAHHPTITAEVVCDPETGEMSIDFTSTAWGGEGSDPTNDPSRANSQIDIRLDGVTATSGAYVPPTYSFSGSLPSPAGKVAGDVVEVSALAVGTWGNGDTTHESTWVHVTIPSLACGDEEHASHGRRPDPGSLAPAEIVTSWFYCRAQDLGRGRIYSNQKVVRNAFANEVKERE